MSTDKQGLSPNDPSSYSLPEDSKVTHLDLDLTVDFNTHIFSGFAHLTVEKQKDGIDTVVSLKQKEGIDTVVLDSSQLKIKSVKDQATGQQLKFSLGDRLEVFGSRLEIKLPNSNGPKSVISVEYETSPNASAFQWLTPEQTAGGKEPYFFSQCQAIHCRSFVPCQDTPAVKHPYTAKITAPKQIVILMSALRLGNEPDSKDSTKTVYRFEQKVPIPSYLIAIVGGDLKSKKIGPRSTVWTEEKFLDAAAYEFAETETMLKTAEDLCGPYVWGNYDLLVLPPSFPYGGMENPCLTFVTPTLLAGDRSLADVVAHEIAHSWTGNLVTNRNPEHFWLNEGHTVFVERKIKGKMYGEPYRQFSASEGWQDLHNTVVNVQNNGPYTKLIPDLRGVDPDDAFSIVPYEKGFTLLYYIETLVGGPDAFEPFLKAYADKFKYQSIDSDQWKEFLLSFFSSKADVLSKIDWKTWFYKEGMPVFTPKYDESVATPCQELCDRWSKATDSEISQFNASDIQSLSANQIRIFLYKVLLLENPVSENKVKKMEELYKFNSVKNSEIRLKWLLLCIKVEWEDSIRYALNFVNEQGRMKFVRPIYRALYAWEGARQKALKNFNAHRSQMHSTTAELLAKDLHIQN